MHSEQSQLLEIIARKIAEISVNENFWMIRTDSGKWFEDFTRNNFVAIGWDEVPRLTTFPPEKTHRKWRKSVATFIKETYPPREGEKPVRAGYILSQLIKFEQEIKINDYVIAPSQSSGEIAIGRIVSLNYSDVVRSVNCDNICPFRRRYAVRWISRMPRSSLNGPVWSSFYSQHTVLNLTEYADSFCKKLFPIYIRNDTMNYVFKVAMERNLSATELFSFSKLLNLADGAGTILGNGFTKRDLDVKVILQSPGDFQFLATGREAVSGLLLMALLLSACSTNQTSSSNVPLSSTERDVILSSEAIGASADNDADRLDSLVSIAKEMKALSERTR